MNTGYSLPHTVVRKIIPAIICICCLSACFSSGWSGSEELRKADELSRQGKHDQAIAAYRQHMEMRLRDSTRPEWENPYFYLLLIGDSYLQRGDPQQALSYYEEAERKGVDATLISDRYRAVAHWFEERGELQQALEVLKKYRDRDSLLFDSMLDRIARELTEREDSGEAASEALLKVRGGVSPQPIAVPARAGHEFPSVAQQPQAHSP